MVSRVLSKSRKQRELDSSPNHRFVEDIEPQILNFETIYEEGFKSFKKKLKKSREKMTLSERIKIVSQNQLLLSVLSPNLLTVLQKIDKSLLEPVVFLVDELFSLAQETSEIFLK